MPYHTIKYCEEFIATIKHYEALCCNHYFLFDILYFIEPNHHTLTPVPSRPSKVWSGAILPDPNLNPIGPVHQCLAMNLNLSRPGPKGSVQVQFRSGPEPQGKSQKKNIYRP
jgi:hypothetical protein